MKTQLLERDVRVFCVTADSFPDGVKAAWQKLHSIVPMSGSRTFYGLSRMENGKIVYKPAVEEATPGEGEKYGCETVTIAKGEYLAEALPNWRGYEHRFVEIFRELFSDPRIDRSGWCVEKYIGEKEALCMIRMDDAKAGYSAAGQAQKIAPFLWLNGNVAEALDFYTSVFKNSKVVNARRIPPAVAGGKERVMSAVFQLEGLEFMALDAGPQFKFTPAVSFFVKCKSQEEVDDLWDKLTANGGAPGRCGWLVDPFGVSWQIIPDALGKYLGDPDPAKAKRALDAMMKMNKIDIAELEKANRGEG